MKPTAAVGAAYDATVLTEDHTPPTPPEVMAARRRADAENRVAAAERAVTKAERFVAEATSDTARDKDSGFLEDARRELEAAIAALKGL